MWTPTSKRQTARPFRRPDVTEGQSSQHPCLKDTTANSQQRQRQRPNDWSSASPGKPPFLATSSRTLPYTGQLRCLSRLGSAHYLAWTKQQWSKVLFLNESQFTLSFNDGRIHVWRRPGQHFHDAAVRQHNRYGGGSVMVWGSFGMLCGTPLYCVLENLTGIG